MKDIVESSTGPKALKYLRMSYFDALPRDVLRNIISHILQLVRKMTMNENEQLAPLKTNERVLLLSVLFSEDGPFSDLVSTMLSMVSVDSIFDATYFSPNLKSIVIGSEVFETKKLAERILKVCGKSTKEIKFSKIYEGNSKSVKLKEKKTAEMFVSLVLAHYPHVEKIIFESVPPQEDIAPILMARFSSQLRSIEWNEWRTHMIYLHTPNLRTCVNIRELHFPCSRQLLSFLRASGSSLEILIVQLIPDPTHVRDLLDVIQCMCRNLTKILFKHYLNLIRVVGEDRYASFLCSFGARLTRADFNKLSPPKFLEVYANCANLDISSLSVENCGADDWKKVRIAGPRIERLIVDHESCINESCQSAIAECTNLQYLWVKRGRSEELIIPDNLQLRFLSSLSSLSITNFMHLKFTATQRNIEVLASSFENLRSLRLRLAVPINIGIDFKAAANSMPQLNSVSIHEYFNYGEYRVKDQSLKVLQMLIDSFSKCRCIEFTILKRGRETVTRDEIRDICGSLPCREMDINIAVGSTRYRLRG